MNKYDLMSGPICRRGSDFIRSEEDVVPKLYKRNIAFQTAVRNDKTEKKYLKRKSTLPRKLVVFVETFINPGCLGFTIAVNA